MIVKKNFANVERYAELFRVLSNSKRLRIVCALEDGELSVEDLAKKLNMNTTNISQHLMHLRYTKIVKTRRDKTRVIYSLSSKKILEFHGLVNNFFNEIEK